MRRRAGRLNMSALVALLLTLLVGVPASDSPVADAAERGDIEEVRQLLRNGADVNAAQGDGMTALHWAAVNDRAELVELLVYAGANLGATTRLGGYQPLHLAGERGHAAAIRALVNSGAEVDTHTDTGLAPLHYAAASGETAAVAALLEGGATLDDRDGGQGRTPLVFATALNRLDIVDQLIAAGADPNLATEVEDFAERGRLDGPERRRRNELMAAIKKSQQPEGWQEEEEPEEEAPAEEPEEDEDDEAEEGESDDEAAAPAPDVELSGATPPAEQPPVEPNEEPDEDEAEDEDDGRSTGAPLTPLGYTDYVGKQGGLTALHYAARDGRLEAAKKLLAAGAELNGPTEGDRTTPLLIATINGQYDLAMHLLEEGADPNLASDDGAAPLYAVLNNRWAPKSLYPQPTAFKQQGTDYLELMRALLAAGAEVNRRLEHHIWYSSFNFDLLGVNFSGATPFWRAAYALDVPAMELLLEYGADPTIPTRVVPSRRRGGGDDEEEDPSGLPPAEVGGPAVYPIHAASGVGYGTSRAGNSHRHAPDAWLPAVKFLVEVTGADVNRRDHDGYSPVHHAAARGDDELIRYLVAQGADVTFVSRRGQTTVDMANGPQQRVQPFPETIALLEGLGAVNNDNCLSC